MKRAVRKALSYVLKKTAVMLDAAHILIVALSSLTNQRDLNIGDNCFKLAFQRTEYLCTV